MFENIEAYSGFYPFRDTENRDTTNRNTEKNEDFFDAIDVVALLFLSIMIIRNRRMIVKLETSEKQYRRMIENSPEGIFVHIKGDFVYANKSAKQLLGIPIEDDIKKYSIFQFLTDDNLQTVKDYFQKTNHANEKEETFELNFVKKDGEKVIMEGISTSIVFSFKPAREVLIRDITLQKQIAEQMEFDAYFDALTELPNRKVFHQRLDAAAYEATKHDSTFAVMFIDLDGFKHVNDTFGHDAGDFLLIEVAKRLKHAVRNGDLVARLAGDEFTILLPNSNHEEVHHVAKQILHHFKEPIHINKKNAPITVSIGIAIYPEHSMDPIKLVKFADMAMYQVKRGGKNAYHIYDPSLSLKGDYSDDL